jgi:hypothetical protein
MRIVSCAQDDTPETAKMLRAWFASEGRAALNEVIDRAKAEVVRD